jgi:hypothetical protein
MRIRLEEAAFNIRRVLAWNSQQGGSLWWTARKAISEPKAGGRLRVPLESA